MAVTLGDASHHEIWSSYTSAWNVDILSLILKWAAIK